MSDPKIRAMEIIRQLAEDELARIDKDASGTNACIPSRRSCRLRVITAAAGEIARIVEDASHEYHTGGRSMKAVPLEVGGVYRYRTVEGGGTAELESILDGDGGTHILRMRCLATDCVNQFESGMLTSLERLDKEGKNGQV